MRTNADLQKKAVYGFAHTATRPISSIYCVGFLLSALTVIRSLYSQLSISRVQFCSSRGYLLRSIIHAAVVVILEKEDTDGGEERRIFEKLYVIFIIVSNRRWMGRSWWLLFLCPFKLLF